MRFLTIATILLIISSIYGSEFGSDLQQGARQEGMGGAFTAVADDGEATIYNPAGLINIKNYEAMVSYSRNLQNIDIYNGGEINIGYLGYVHNFGESFGSLSFRWNYRNSKSGDYNASENMFFLGYGRKIKDLFFFLSENTKDKYLDDLSIGFSLRYMDAGWHDIDQLPFANGSEDLTSDSWSFGLGLRYVYNKVGVGFNIKNINKPDIGVVGEHKDEIDLSAGAFWKYNPNSDKDLIAFDYNYENEEGSLRAGTEYYFDFQDNFLQSIGLRGGVEYFLDDESDAINYTTGLGFEFDYGFNFDYSVKFLTGGFEDTPLNHTISLVLEGRDEAKKDIYIEEIINKLEEKPEEIVEVEIEPEVETVTPEIYVEEIPEPTPAKKNYIVVKGDYLIKIAKLHEKPLRFWEMIYFYNKEVIDNRNKRNKGLLAKDGLESFDLIFPDQEFKIYTEERFNNQIVEEVTGLSTEQEVSDIILLRYKREQLWKVLNIQFDVEKHDFYIYSSSKDIADGKSGETLVKVDKNFNGVAYPGQYLIVLDR